MHRYGWILLAALLSLGGCDRNTGESPATLRVSAVPDRAPAEVRAKHKALLDHVCKTAGVTCQWVDSSSYEDTGNRLGRGEIDLAYLGGATFVLAHQRHAAVPLAMRDIDMRFTSSIYVRANNPARTLQDLRSHSFAFGPQQSTSGYIMPRYFFRQAGIEPEEFFSLVVYSKGHDDTLERIERGDVMAGVVNSNMARRTLKTRKHNLRLLWESTPYADYVWVARAGLSDDLKQRLRGAFLGLRLSNPSERAILDQQGAHGYLPARVDDFTELAASMQRSSRQGERE